MISFAARSRTSVENIRRIRALEPSDASETPRSLRRSFHLSRRLPSALPVTCGESRTSEFRVVHCVRTERICDVLCVPVRFVSFEEGLEGSMKLAFRGPPRAGSSLPSATAYCWKANQIYLLIPLPSWLPCIFRGYRGLQTTHSVTWTRQSGWRRTQVRYVERKS